ncbi:TRAP transporter substrate-binding protein [Pseudahrensia aquimaris]|uniref:TRAP transporter substrate-binding protein n=1 Tax=Pseudahrensia aquimaris TaxID=744461 RepID=A0ABW3FAD9_9HYPH
MNIAKSLAVALCAATLSLSAVVAQAADITLKLAHVAPAQTTYQQAAERFKANLEEASGGTMSVDIVPGGVLGDLGQLWAQTRAGAIDLHLIDIGATIAMKEARPFLVMWTPFLFKDQAHFHRYMESDTFKTMMKDVEEKTGVVYLGYAGDRPPRALTTADKAVKTKDDLAGMKIRTPEHPMIIGAFKAWGANPTPIKASELFTALKTGLVDGQDNGVIDFVGAGYADAQKFYMPLDYIHSGVGIWMSGAKFEGLNDEQKAWVREAAAKAGVDGKKIHADLMAENMAKLESLGVTTVQPDISTFEFARDGIVGNMEGKMWEDGLVAKIRGM